MLAPTSSAAVHLAFAAVSSEIANAAKEMAVAAGVDSATVAELMLVFLPEGPDPGGFQGFLSCRSLAFSARVNLLYTDVG